MKYVATDCETGGLGPEADLLTVYFGIFDKDLNLIDELDLKIRPESENDFFSVSAKALEINKINLVTHFQEAETRSTAGNKLFQLLKKHSDEGKDKLVPIGHNVSFDIDKINSKLLGKKTWDQFVQYRKLDTGTISQFLKITGHLPANLNASLGKILGHLGLEFEGEAHTARADALATVAVIKKLKEMVKV